MFGACTALLGMGTALINLILNLPGWGVLNLTTLNPRASINRLSLIGLRLRRVGCTLSSPWDNIRGGVVPLPLFAVRICVEHRWLFMSESKGYK